MTLKWYLRWIVFLTALDAIVLTYFYSADLNSDLTRPFLVLKGLIDGYFILTNSRKLALKRFEIFLLAVLVVHSLVGMLLLPIVNSAYQASRAFNDVVWPVIFILKIVVLREVLEEQGLPAGEFKALCRNCLMIAVLQIAIFMVFSRFSGAYAGITPPINLPLAYALSFAQPGSILLSMLIILLSGKRSFLLGAMVAVGLRAFVQKQNRVPFIIAGTVAVFGFVFLIGGATSGLLPEDISDKFKASGQILDLLSIVFTDGPGALFDDAVRHEFYLATAGRSEEFFSVISQMSWYNFIIGRGAGFTYSYMHWDGWVDGYANSHFSPLALTYKFGLFYAAAMYYYIFSGIVTLIKSMERFASMVGIGLIMYLIQSFLAFNLFVELLLPLLVALRPFLVGHRARKGSANQMPANVQVANVRS